jgi:hypothetical protein
MGARSAVGRAAVAALAAAFVLLGLLSYVFVQRPAAVVEAPQAPEAGGPVVEARAAAQLGLHNRLEVYKNGGLVYAKDGDPWTVNLGKLLVLFMFSTDHTDVPPLRPTFVVQPHRLTTVTTVFSTITPGGEILVGNTRALQNVVVGIGSGTAPFSVNDVSLASTITLQDVLDPGSVAFADAGDFYWLNITGQFTGLTATVSEAGLFRRIHHTGDPPLPDTQPLALLAREVISPAISLAPDDLLAVKYAIRISKLPFVRYGLCDFVQTVFGLMTGNLLPSFPCPRTTSPGNIVYNIPRFGLVAGLACKQRGWSGPPPCVRAVFATQSVAFTDRFTVTAIPAGADFAVTQSATTITTNATHLIIRTVFQHAPASSTTFYGLAVYRDAVHASPRDPGSVAVTLTGFTTRVATAAGWWIWNDWDFSQKYLLMFIPFDPPVTAPPGSRIRVTLELALPIG